MTARRFTLTLGQPATVVQEAPVVDDGGGTDPPAETIGIRFVGEWDGNADGSVIGNGTTHTLGQNNIGRGVSVVLSGVAPDAAVSWSDDAAAVLTSYNTVTVSTDGPAWVLYLNGYGNDGETVTITATYNGTDYVALLTMGDQT